jgi:hypothetical protein
VNGPVAGQVESCRRASAVLLDTVSLWTTPANAEAHSELREILQGDWPNGVACWLGRCGFCDAKKSQT